MKFCLLLYGLLACPSQASEITNSVGAFAKNDFSGWEEKSFSGHTTYEPVKDVASDRILVQAQTRGAASGLFRKIEIDLTKTPMLNWSWKIEKPYAGIDENTRDGDDFPVRVYMVAERGLPGLSMRAINHVWASKNQVGTSWTNPFTTQARMIAVDSGSENPGKWVRHRRNARDDLKAAFRDDFTEAHAVVVMTDGDNSGMEARTWYGDIPFSGR
jgi:hypothetical protein